MGRFISGDTFTSTGGLMGNNMMAYCLNNPANFYDNRGTDAIWIQEKERGGGYGHSGLLVDDGEGNWYFLYWGSAGTSTDLEKIFGTPYEFVFVKIDVSEYDLYSIDGVIDALANSGNGTALIRSQYVTGTYYFEGDYSATYDYLSKMAEREENKSGSLGKYYLLTKNCAQVTWEALAQSNVRLQENSCPFIPNIAFGRAQYLDGMSNLHYGIFRSTMVAIN